MPCPKDTAISLTIFLTVLVIVSGMMFNQISHIQAELEQSRDLVYNVPSIVKNIEEIKADIKEIKADIKELSRR